MNQNEKQITRTTVEKFVAQSAPAANNDDQDNKTHVIELEPADDVDDDDFVEPTDEKTRALDYLESLPFNTQVSIIVDRLPDAFNQREMFVKTCSIPQNVGTFKWNCGNASDAELLTYVQNDFGGGNYQFRIRGVRGFTGLGWNETLSDTDSFKHKFKIETQTREIERAKNEIAALNAANNPNTTTATIIQPPPPPSPPTVLDMLRELNEQKTLMKELGLIPETPPAAAITPTIADNAYGLVQYALQSSNSDLGKAALDFVREQQKDVPEKSLWDFAGETFDNPDRVVQLEKIGTTLLTTVAGLLLPLFQQAETPPTVPKIRRVPQPPQPQIPQPQIPQQQTVTQQPVAAPVQRPLTMRERAALGRMNDDFKNPAIEINVEGGGDDENR